MSRSATLILFGVLVILVPFSGLPITLRTILSVLFGAVVLGIGIFMRSESARAGRTAAPGTESVPAPASTPAEPVIEEPEPKPVTPPHGVSPI